VRAADTRSNYDYDYHDDYTELKADEWVTAISSDVSLT
jgi:hypothetical protein